MRDPLSQEKEATNHRAQDAGFGYDTRFLQPNWNNMEGGREATSKNYQSTIQTGYGTSTFNHVQENFPRIGRGEGNFSQPEDSSLSPSLSLSNHSTLSNSANRLAHNYEVNSQNHFASNDDGVARDIDGKNVSLNKQKGSRNQQPSDDVVHPALATLHSVAGTRIQDPSSRMLPRYNKPAQHPYSGRFWNQDQWSGPNFVNSPYLSNRFKENADFQTAVSRENPSIYSPEIWNVDRKLGFFLHKVTK